MGQIVGLISEEIETVKEEIETVNGEISCPFCEKKYAKEEALEKHIKSKHPEKIEKEV